MGAVVLWRDNDVTLPPFLGGAIAGCFFRGRWVEWGFIEGDFHELLFDEFTYLVFRNERFHLRKGSEININSLSVCKARGGFLNKTGHKKGGTVFSAWEHLSSFYLSIYVYHQQIPAFMLLL